jgi:hypothetical protein
MRTKVPFARSSRASTRGPIPQAIGIVMVAAATRELIDLAECYNARLVDSWHGGAPGNGLD